MLTRKLTKEKDREQVKPNQIFQTPTNTEFLQDRTTGMNVGRMVLTRKIAYNQSGNFENWRHYDGHTRERM